LKKLDGADILRLKVPQVHCKDGRIRDFVLSPKNWAGSILKQSNILRNVFTEVTAVALEREELLLTLKDDTELWKRVEYCMSDFLCFQHSEERLTMDTGDAPPLMSPFYFSSDEAGYLGNIPTPSSIQFEDALSLLLEEKGKEGTTTIYASHDISPVLHDGFEVKKGYHKGDKIKKNRKKLIKNREKELSFQKLMVQRIIHGQMIRNPISWCRWQIQLFSL
jgi:hypothetical protein